MAQRPTVFLSHAGADTAAADALRARLVGAGLDVWFDKRDLRAGSEQWQKQIEDQIEQVDGFVVYVGSRGVVNWVEAETRLALSRAISGSRQFAFASVLSARVKDGSRALPGFARQFQAVRDVENRPEEWNRLLAALAGKNGPSPELKPFVGLSAIDANCSHLFFGRCPEIEDAVARLRDRNLLLVLGASGSGKSSLVRAGVVPAWRGNAVGVLRSEDPEDHDWLSITMTPKHNPLESLSKAVQEAAEEQCGLSPTEAGVYAGLVRSPDHLTRERGLFLTLDPQRARVLLVVDQFEELMVNETVNNDERKDFAQFLSRLADPLQTSFAVALTMRSDYTNHLGRKEMADLRVRLDADEGRARLRLRSILDADADTDADGHAKERGRVRLREVVTGPLALARVPDDEAEALANMVLRDVGAEAGDLALLQFALTETWRTSGGGKSGLLTAYSDLGGVEGALARSADAAVADLLMPERGLTETDVEAALIRLGSLLGTVPLRRIAPRSEFTEPGWQALQFFASEDGRRLVQIDGEGDAATAEIAHEALLTQWPLLNGWLAAYPSAKRLLDGLAVRAREVAEAVEVALVAEVAEVQPPLTRRPMALIDFLLRAHRLEEPDPGGPVLPSDDARRYAHLLSTHPEWLTQAETDLLLRSLRHHDRVRERESRLPKVMGAWLGMIASAMVIVLVLMVLASALWLSGRAERERAERNEAAALAGLAEVKIERREERAGAILALAATARVPELVGSRQAQVVDAAMAANDTFTELRQFGEVRTWDFATEIWFTAIFSPDGAFVLTGVDNIAQLWNATTGEEIRPFEGHRDKVTSVAFSLNGAFVLTGSYDRTAALWDVATGKKIRLFKGHTDKVTSVAFSPDGVFVLTGSYDGTVRLWNAATGEQLQRFEDPGPEHRVISVAFSQDPAFVLSGSREGTAYLWNVATGAKVRQFGDNRLSLSSAAFSPDGAFVFISSDDGIVRVWDVETGAEERPFYGGSEIVNTVAISPNGTFMLTGSDDRAARLWNVAIRAVVQRFTVHTEAVISVAFSPDEAFVLIGSTDLTALLLKRKFVGPDRIALLCDHLDPILPAEIRAIEAEYDLILPPVCTPEQRANQLPPLYTRLPWQEITE